MKINGKTIILETFSEVQEVFYAPVEYEQQEGVDQAIYAMFLYSNNYDESYHGYSVEYSDPTLHVYLEKLKDSVQKRKLANFNFYRGVEEDNSWWGIGINCISRLNSSDELQSYYRVAKVIAQQTFSKFNFKTYDDRKRITRTIEVKHISSNTTFNIDDIADPNMYDCIMDWIKQETTEKQNYEIVSNAENFINSLLEIK